LFRLKNNLIDDQISSDTDIYITPVTSMYQPDTFKVIEPTITHLSNDWIISTSYKWNKIIELQLVDGKKVFYFLSKELKFRSNF
jgi:hypothetical protein